MYTDDTLIYVCHKKVNVIEKKLNEDLQNLSNWLVNNHMRVNVNKTKVMLFGTPAKTSKVSHVLFKYIWIIWRLKMLLEVVINIWVFILMLTSNGKSRLITLFVKYVQVLLLWEELNQLFPEAPLLLSTTQWFYHILIMQLLFGAIVVRTTLTGFRNFKTWPWE